MNRFPVLGGVGRTEGVHALSERALCLLEDAVRAYHAVHLDAPVCLHLQRLQTATWKQLRDECKKRCINPAGRKTELLGRLTAALLNPRAEVNRFEVLAAQ